MKMKIEKPKQKYDPFTAAGYCVVKKVLQEDILARLRVVTNELLDAQTEEEPAAYRPSGSMISVYAHSFFVEQVVCPGILQALEALGFLRC